MKWLCPGARDPAGNALTTEANSAARGLEEPRHLPESMRNSVVSQFAALRVGSAGFCRSRRRVSASSLRRGAFDPGRRISESKSVWTSVRTNHEIKTDWLSDLKFMIFPVFYWWAVQGLNL